MGFPRGKSPEPILEDVRKMVETLQSDKAYGPYTLYVRPLFTTTDRRIARRFARHTGKKFMIDRTCKPRVYGFL